MIEDLAIRLVTQDANTLGLIFGGLFFFGAIIAPMVSRSSVEIARAPYFAYSALIVLALTAPGIVWLQTIPAMAAGGYLWVLVAVQLAASFAAGYTLCLISLARSRDAYGTGRMAVLGFIPLAALWLLLTPSKNAISANRVPTIPLLSGGLGVLTGIVSLAVGAGVAIYLDERFRMLAQQAGPGTAAQQQVLVRSTIRSEGLEETLSRMAAGPQAPIAVDDVTTLARIEAVGTLLRRTYVIDTEGMRMTDEFRTRSRAAICAWPPFEPILRAGGSIREIYVESGGRKIGSVFVTSDECGLSMQ